MIYDRTSEDVALAKKIREEKVKTFQDLTEEERNILERGFLTISGLNRIESEISSHKSEIKNMGYSTTTVVDRKNPVDGVDFRDQFEKGVEGYEVYVTTGRVIMNVDAYSSQYSVSLGRLDLSMYKSVVVSYGGDVRCPTEGADIGLSLVNDQFGKLWDNEQDYTNALARTPMVPIKENWKVGGCIVSIDLSGVDVAGEIFLCTPRLNGHGIAVYSVDFIGKDPWIKNMVFMKSDIEGMIKNCMLLKEAFFAFEYTPSSIRPIYNLEEINKIEKTLYDLSEMISDVKRLYRYCGETECGE